MILAKSCLPCVLIELVTVSLNAYKKDTYVLAEPKPSTRGACLKDLENNTLGIKRVKEGIIKGVKQQQTIVQAK